MSVLENGSMYQSFPIKAPKACKCINMDTWNVNSEGQCGLCKGHVAYKSINYNDNHHPDECVGNCSIHPLAEVGNEMKNSTWWWADMVEAELAEMSRCETPDDREARRIADEQEAEARRLDLEASRMHTYAQDQKVLNMRGKGKDRHIIKLDSPCKWLFADEKAPKNKWAKNEQGKLCAPIANHLTGAECWAHSYHDPKTKELIEPHTCKYLHPGENGWHTEWAKNRCFKLPQPVQPRVFSKGSGRDAW